MEAHNFMSVSITKSISQKCLILREESLLYSFVKHRYEVYAFHSASTIPHHTGDAYNWRDIQRSSCDIPEWRLREFMLLQYSERITASEHFAQRVDRRFKILMH